MQRNELLPGIRSERIREGDKLSQYEPRLRPVYMAVYDGEKKYLTPPRNIIAAKCYPLPVCVVFEGFAAFPFPSIFLFVRPSAK